MITRSWAESGDRSIASGIVDRLVMGDESYKKTCVDKILKTVQLANWTRLYSHDSFIFCCYYSWQAPILEICFSLNCQVVDELYFLMTRDSTQQNFATKIKTVFKTTYGHPIREDAANVIRIIRNNVMHMGSIHGTPGRAREADDASLRAFQELHNMSSLDEAFTQVAAKYDLLVGDVVLRILGLEDEDLGGINNSLARHSYFYQE